MARRRGLGLLRVEGPSMLPTLRPGEVVLVRWGARARPGAVVVASWPGHEPALVVKRVARRSGSGWWLVGDNPARSDDSRARGAVPPGAVRGRVLVRVPLAGRGRQPRAASAA